MTKKVSMLYISTNNKEKPSLNDLGKDGSFLWSMILDVTYCNLKKK